MLLGNKTAQKEEQNWCVVLKSVQSEMSKIRLAQKLSQAFELSVEEASDVVSNTPIIILDNLTHPIADQIKAFFSVTGVEMTLTNDLMRKRKYYRTVWPESPSLSFLQNVTSSASVNTRTTSEHAPLAPDEALNEIRSISNNDNAPKSPVSSNPSPPTPIRPTSGTPKEDKGRQAGSNDELEERRRECVSLRDEVTNLKRRLEAKEWEKLSASRSMDADNSAKDKEVVADLKKRLDQSEERYEALREEYREAQSIFEEKFSKVQKQTEEWKTRVSQMESASMDLEKTKSSASEALMRKEQEYRELQEKLENSRVDGEKNLEALNKLRSEQVNLFNRVKELEEALEQEKTSTASAQDEEIKLKHQIVMIGKDLEQVKHDKHAAEERTKDLEKSQLRLIQDFETRTREARDAEERVLDLEKQLTELKEAFEGHEKIARMNLQQLEVREQELQANKYEIKELELKLHDREAHYRRMLVDSRLAEKEMRLKRLIREQQRMEKEVREREEVIRELLMEQTDLEKEIMEDRQANPSQMSTSEKSSASRLKIEKADETEDSNPETKASPKDSD